MNDENLRPITTKKRAREIGSLGGKVVCKNKKVAAQLRELKKKGMSDENVNRMLYVMEDADYSFIDIMKQFNRLEQYALSKDDDKALASLTRMQMDLHKMRHGSAEARTQVNIQNNTQFNINVEEELTNFLEKEVVIENKGKRKTTKKNNKSVQDKSNKA